MKNITSIIGQGLENSLTYAQYRELITNLLGKGQSTGPEQSEALTHYSTLNDVRMNRLDKTITLPETIVHQLQGLTKEYTLLVITEGWCGDAAQIVPVLNKMAAISDKLEMKLVIRDENPELMDEYLTNGARSIPVVVVLDTKTGEPLAKWGPRPVGGTNLIKEAKEKYGKVTDEAKTELQKWYLQDKGLSTMYEVAALLV